MLLFWRKHDENRLAGELFYKKRNAVVDDLRGVHLITWLRNPYGENKAEVRVNEIGARETVYMWLGTVAVTVLFYFVLEYFDTSYLIPSTISVTTSFLAVYLTFRRSSSFTLAYAANDVALIVLWVLASLADARYVSVVVCFAAFLANDVYGYVNWQRIKIRQKAGNAAPERRPEVQS